MEDARFVRFVDDGSTSYLATYTAFDGVDVSQQLLRTTDFLSFDSSSMSGPAAVGKGLALFPRRIGGRFAALSRHDRERNSVAFSESLDHWGRSTPVQVPREDWEMLQLGNCGSPIETAEGWLVLTHGVGPMRTYSIGALLLDLDDPTKVVATMAEPILTPGPDERDGYVPNVVYTCGALLHGDVLVIPYAMADSSISGRVGLVLRAPQIDALDLTEGIPRAARGNQTDPGTLDRIAGGLDSRRRAASRRTSGVMGTRGWWVRADRRRVRDRRAVAGDVGRGSRHRERAGGGLRGLQRHRRARLSSGSTHASTRSRCSTPALGRPVDVRILVPDGYAADDPATRRCSRCSTSSTARAGGRRTG